uniref:DNA damage-binding protein 2 n=1 Tax=Magallana gigas TaxID=29159 RepID=A0A8W8K3K2_MAGGI
MSDDYSIMADTNVVCRTFRTFDRNSTDSSTQKENTLHSSNNQVSSITRSVETGSMPNFRRQFEDQGLSRQTCEILLASWRYSTKKQYGTFIRRWLRFCSEREINSFQPSVKEVLSFLTELYENGLGYSAINTARSALSSYGIQHSGSEKEKEEEKIPSHDCCEVDAANTLLGLKPRALPFTINVARPSYTISSNLTLQLHGYTMGIPRKSLYKSATKCVIDMLSDMQISTMTSPFNRRVTAMDWHPTNPDVVVVGSKGGDVFWWDTSNIEKQKFHQGMGAGGIINSIKFWPHDNSKVLTAAVDGTITLNDIEGKNTQILADTLNAHENTLYFIKGSGGNIQAVKFWPLDECKVVSAGLDGTVSLHDLNGKLSFVLADTMNFYDFWYCSVDVHAGRKFVSAGDNVGKLQFLSYEGKKTFEFRLHKNKITHCEFSPMEEWMLCTASTDQTVQIWDVRMIKDRNSSMCTLKHEKPVNSG